MTSLSTLPQYPVPGRPCQLSFALTESGANYLRVWVTDAPKGSKLKAALNKNGEKRSVFYVGDSTASSTFEPDVGGIYTLVCQEYVKGTGYGGAYEGDPNGAPSETKTGGEFTVAFVVGQRVTQTLGLNPDTATFVLWIFGDYIRATTLATHGEASPAIQAPTSLRARIASESSNVLSSLADTVDGMVSDAVGDLAAVAADIRTKFNAHFADTGPHNAADAANTLPPGVATDVSPKSLPDFVNRLLSALRYHYQNIDPADGALDTTGWHEIASVSRADRKNLPLVESVGDLAQAYAALGDIVRSYEAHRLNLQVHSPADMTHGLGTTPNLIQVHRYFFEALASLAPAVPPTMNGGVVTAVSIAGFTES